METRPGLVRLLCRKVPPVRSTAAHRQAVERDRVSRDRCRIVGIRVQQSPPASPETQHRMPGVLGPIHEGFDGCVEARYVAPASQNPNSHVATSEYVLERTVPSAKRCIDHPVSTFLVRCDH